MEEARNVLIALIDAKPDMRRIHTAQIVDQRRGLAIARRRGDPAHAGAQGFLDLLEDAGTPQNLKSARRHELGYSRLGRISACLPSRSHNAPSGQRLTL